MSDNLPAGKILRPLRNFLGREWKQGELFTKEDISGVAPHILKALENGQKIEIFSESHKSLEPLQIRIEILEKQMSDLLRYVEGAEEPAPQTPNKRGRPRKDS